MISEKKKNEIIAFLWLVSAGLLLLCLISHHPDDIAYLTSAPNNPLNNYVGVAGAYVSWMLMSIIGKGAYFIVALFVFWALTQWSERKLQSPWIRILSGGLFFLASCSTLTLMAGPIAAEQFSAGGIAGYFVASVLRQVFGPAAPIISCAFFLLSLLLATEFMLYPMTLAVVEWLKKLSVNGWKLTVEKVQEITKKVESIKIQKKEPRTKVKIKGMGFPEDNQDKEKDLATPDAKKSIFKKTTDPKPDTFEGNMKSTSAKPTIPKQTKPKEDGVPVLANSGSYVIPSLDLLVDPIVKGSIGDMSKVIEEQSRILDDTMNDFGIDAKVVEAEQGPVITRFELKPGSGVKLQRITALQDNIALCLQATSVRILAPIPGKPRIGIEVPNDKKQMVFLKDILESPEMSAMESKLAFAIGKDAAGAPLIADLDQLPHLLIAGSTGSGKTVCVNTIIMSILFRSTPDEVRFIMIDPKMVELINYNGLPHLLTPVITETDKVPSVLNWLVGEMERRYKILSKSGCREVEIYNAKLIEKFDSDFPEGSQNRPMPYIVTIIDELADLMMSQGKQIEMTITRLAQLARAVGIHMILATQRPSVDVITGVIKANFPARLSFQVTSKVDSRTVLDQNGADCLLGKGDLLYMDPAKSHLTRGQGAWVTDNEINGTVADIKAQSQPEYHEGIAEAQTTKREAGKDFREDTYYTEACEVIVTTNQASVSMLQRKLGLGYTRAARLVDMMEEDGIVGPHRGSKAREVLIDLVTLKQKFSGDESSSEDEELTEQNIDEEANEDEDDDNSETTN